MLFSSRASTRRWPRLALLLASSALSQFVLSACATPPVPPSLDAATSESSRREAGVALSRYAELLRAQDAQTLSLLFEPNGSLAHEGLPPVIGRSAIRRFLESFSSYKVLSHDMRVASVAAEGTRVRQSGTYEQSVRTPEGQTVRVNGKFVAVWQRQSNGDLLIESMRTAAADS